MTRQPTLKQQLLQQNLTPKQIKQMFGDLRFNVNKAKARHWLNANATNTTDAKDVTNVTDALSVAFAVEVRKRELVKQERDATLAKLDNQITHATNQLQKTREDYRKEALADIERQNKVNKCLKRPLLSDIEVEQRLVDADRGYDDHRSVYAMMVEMLELDRAQLLLNQALAQ